MRFRSALYATFALILPCHLADAGMITMDVASYNLSDPGLAKTIAKWDHGEHLAVTEKGLGWEGAKTSSRDLRLLLQPVAIGHGWRPPGHAGVQLKLNFEDDERSQMYFQTYIRYSPNGENWSTWQPLTQNLPHKKGSPKADYIFKGHISVPQREKLNYRAKQREYGKLDVPWTSDEHAMCEWIVENAPKFFEKNLPFPGFFQVCVEGSLHGGNRLKSVVVEHSTSTSGMSTVPKDPAARKKREGKWAFWTVKEDAKEPECGFQQHFVPPPATR